MERPRETVEPLCDYELTNAPGKSLVMLKICYPPDGFTPPHRHGGATVVATITSGTILSGMNGNPPILYEPGETFRELPGCHHTVSENGSKTGSASFIAVFIVDTEVIKDGYESLVVLDSDPVASRL